MGCESERLQWILFPGKKRRFPWANPVKVSVSREVVKVRRNLETWMKDPTFYLADRLSSCGAMINFFRQFAALILFGVYFGCAASSAGQDSGVGVPALREEAMARLSEGSLTEALPLFEALASQSAPESFAHREAAFYVDYAALSLDLARAGFGSWQALPEEPWGKRLQALEEAARELRAMAPEPKRWLTVYEYLGAVQTHHRWQEEIPGLGAYGEIFNFWAESTNLEEGRRQYFRLVGELAEVRELPYNRRAQLMPFVENAAGLAETPESVQRFQWLFASFLARYESGPNQQLRRGSALRRAIEAGEAVPTRYYVMALLDFGEWASHYGVSSYGESGKLRFQPDYALAAETYRTLLALGDLPNPAQIEQAQSRLEWIESVELEIMVPYNFRPDTEIHFFLKWRNLESPTVRIYAIEPALVASGFFDDFERIDPGTWPVIEEQVLNTAAEAPHYPVDSRVRLETDLSPGAYLLEARGLDTVRRSLLLVSDLAVVTHSVAGDLIGYACDPMTGHPVRGATVLSVARDRESGESSTETSETDENGLISLSPDMGGNGTDQLLVVAHPERGVALALRNFAIPFEAERRLKVYGMAERELFRPGETVRAHIWARWATPDGWHTPEAGTEVQYRIIDPRGNLAKEGTVTLSDLGSASFDCELSEEAALGPYTVHYQLDGKSEIQDSTHAFFRVEAFRAPEIKVAIELEPPSAGTRLVGDVLRGHVAVSYYSGGEVEDASVELIVRRQRFIPWPWRNVGRGEDFLPSTMIRPVEPMGEVQRLTLSTDARGLASFEIATIDDGEAEWTYILEARVRDLSRREVSARRSVTLSRQGYYAQLELEHRLIAPGDRAELDIRLRTADEEPVSDRGTLRVTRERWREVYIHRRRGDEIGAEAYHALPERSLLVSAQSDYYLKEKGFVTEEILTELVSTDESGYAHFTFEPEQAGYYNFNWVSRGRRGQPVVAETALWVSDSATSEIGYRPGGVELIADRGPHAPGEIVPLLISVPSPNRSVLISIVGEALIESFVVAIEGTSRVISLEPTAAYQPNAFIAATMVAEASLFHDELEFLVPPKEHFLDITLTPDADGYEPRDTAKFLVEVRDAHGDPVDTDVAISVADESLHAIAPRQRIDVVDAFYGDRRYNRLGVGGSLQWREFFRPLEVAAEGGEDPFESPQAALNSKGFEVNPMRMAAEGVMAYQARDMLSVAMPPPMRLAQPSAQAIDAPPGLVEAAFTRQDFRSTAFWNPRVETDEAGRATIEFTFPDNLTQWRAEAVAVTGETAVGETTAYTSTRLPLIARLQAPRFLTERDEVVLSGTFQNNSEDAETVEAQLSVGAGIELESPSTQTVEVPPDSTRRLEWKAHAVSAGVVEIELRARSRLAGDAVARSLPVVAHGMEIVESISGRYVGERLELTFDVPSPANAVEVGFVAAPTLATQLFSALPYLIEYPYGCTEQVLSRFLPALAVRQAMSDLGYPLDAIDAEIFKGLSPEARGGREDLRDVLEDVVEQSVARLAEMQKEDGSWPWMPRGATDGYMTAYAVYALTLAEELGVELGDIRLAAAREWVERTLTEEEMTAADRAWMLHALASRHRAAGFGRPTRLEARAFLRLIQQRAELGPMHLALLTLTAKYFGFEEDAEILLGNLANFARESEATLDAAKDASGNSLGIPQVHWGEATNYFQWSDGAVETTAMALEALLAVRPDHPWVEAAATWLVRNRTGTYWENTRSTALATLALTSYLQAHEGETGPVRWSLEVNGSAVDLPPHEDPRLGGWSAPLDLRLPAELLQPGENRLVLSQPEAERGFYFSLHQRYFSDEEPLEAATSDLSVTRSVHHLAPVPTLLSGIKEEMHPLRSGEASVGSGDRIEVTLRLETTRDLRYVLVEDVKPAGFEAVQQLSGSLVFLTRVDEGSLPAADADDRVPAHQELHDRKVGFLIERLPAGTWELRYRLRAEAPGDFHGLPAMVEAMYLPDVRGNSDEFRVEVISEDE